MADRANLSPPEQMRLEALNMAIGCEIKRLDRFNFKEEKVFVDADNVVENAKKFLNFLVE